MAAMNQELVKVKLERAELEAQLQAARATTSTAEGLSVDGDARGDADGLLLRLQVLTPLRIC